MISPTTRHFPIRRSLPSSRTAQIPFVAIALFALIFSSRLRLPVALHDLFERFSFGMHFYPALALVLKFLPQVLQLSPRFGDAVVQAVQKRGVILKPARGDAAAAAFIFELNGVLTPEHDQLLELFLLLQQALLHFRQTLDCIVLAGSGDGHRCL